MVRLFKFLLFATAFFAGATFATNYTYAQPPTSTSTPSPASTNTATGTPSPLATPRPRTDTPEAEVASIGAVTATATITAGDSTTLVPTATVADAINESESDDAEPDADVAVPPDGPLDGTILANRSEEVAQFFVEGQTYRLNAGRSQGFALPRSTTVLNLYNCAGDLTADAPGCFWDPYLINQDGFYEIYNSSTAVDQVKLMLREAGAPPTGQVYVQNRTEHKESVVFKDEVYEIDPTLVVEFPVPTGVPAILYVRNCLTIDNQSACEWAPKSLDAGVYYAMIEMDVPGSQVGSMQTTIDLRPVVGEGEATPVVDVAASGPSVMCSVVVPALNVRSGPGLQYDIIDKVRTTDGAAVTVDVTGRSADNEWLTVAESITVGGWINNSPSFITCTGDLLTLPVLDAPPLPTPQPVIVVDTPPASDEATTEAPTAPVAEQGTSESDAAEADSEEAGGDAADQAVPAGQAMLVINNGFQHEMRFTLDQQYRPVEGPSEFDLQPGQTLNIVVYPGNIPFTGSSPWSGLSGNASINVAADEARTLWLRFEPEQGGAWVFRWE